MVPAVLALRAEGFAVTRREDGGQEQWRAESPDLLLIADDPLELLGLASLRMSRGTEWKASDRDIAEILEEYYGDATVE